MNVLILTAENEDDNNLQQMVNVASSIAKENTRIVLCILTQRNHQPYKIQTAIDEVFICSKERSYPWEAVQAIEVIGDIMSAKAFDLVIFENSQIGSEACACLACDLAGESITNIINVELADGELSVTKPIYSSNLNAVYRIKRKPCFITLRDGVKFPSKMRVGKPATIVNRSYEFKENRNVAYLCGENVGHNIMGGAKSVVAAGRGIKNEQDLLLIQEFARHIKAKLGGSRPLVMNGLLSTERMIGQSGKIIAPDLCIAVGVSGATPFAVGIQQSKKIIAINKDKEAPIFKYADIGVVADYHDVLPDLFQN